MAASIDLEYPFTGRWIVQNSPANRVPSHGTALLATSYAIDFVPAEAPGAPHPSRSVRSYDPNRQRSSRALAACS